MDPVRIMAEYTVAKLEEIPPGRAKKIQIDERRIAIFNVGGNFYAIDDCCTHAKASLSEGEIEEETVICPLHGSKFDLKTGKALTLPAVLSVRTYPVTVVEGELKITF